MVLVIICVHLVEVHFLACSLVVFGSHLIADALYRFLVSSCLGVVQLDSEVVHLGSECICIEIRVYVEIVGCFFDFLQRFGCISQFTCFFGLSLGIQWNDNDCHNDGPCNCRSPGRFENEEYQRKDKGANRDK